MPTEVKGALHELRTTAKRLRTDLVASGTSLGRGTENPVKAVFGLVMRAAGLPATADLRPMLFALWLEEQGVLDDARSALGDEFRAALEAFLLDDRAAQAALAAKPSLAPDVDTLMDRLNARFATEPEATPDLLAEKARQALTRGGRKMPLTLIVLDEVQQFLREDPNRAKVVQDIAEVFAAKFKGRILLVATGQSALGDLPYLDKLLGRFPLRFPLGSADINSVVRKTVLRKKDTQLPALDAMLVARSGEIDKHLQGSALQRTAAERDEAAADWPLLATRRKLWERVMQELDRSGLGQTLRSQLRLTLDAVRTYGDKQLGVAVPGDFMLDNFGAEALSRQLIGREFFDKVEVLRAEGGDGGLKARILLIVYMLSRIAADDSHGVRAKEETIADLLVEDLADAASVRGKVPGLLAELASSGHLVDTGGEWRLQTKESADWQSAFNKAKVDEASDIPAIARKRSELLQAALDEALAGATNLAQGASKTPRRIERVIGHDKPKGNDLVLRLWNGWDHGVTEENEIKAADVATDPTLHLFVPAHRNSELNDAIVTMRAVPLVMQRMGVPTTEGGKEAKAGMQARLDRAQKLAEEILREAVESARVMVAGGSEVGTGHSRADAVKEAAGRALTRLYKSFDAADHTGWAAVVAKAKGRDPDAMKEVGHTGEPQDHPVCKAILRACGSGKRGSELRKLFGEPPYGWPREAIDGALRVLALAGHVKVKDNNHKPIADLATLNDQALPTCTFEAESRPATAVEKIKVRSIASELDITVKSGDELTQLHAIVDRLKALANAAGGDPPAPPAPEVPGADVFHTASGNDLLAELASRDTELKAAIADWRAAAKLKAGRLPAWHLLEKLVALGASDQAAGAEAIRTSRRLLESPDPVPPLVTAAADTLRTEANAVWQGYQAAWDDGEERLAADEAWGKLSPEKRHELRTLRGLLQRHQPDLTTPDKIVVSLGQTGLEQWRDLVAAHPSRVEAVLADAAVEVEPKTQAFAIPRRTLKTADDLDAWLDELRAQIEPLLSSGPVRPTS